MDLKELNTRAGSISDYLGYLLLLFAWYAVNYTYKLVIPESAGAAYLWVGLGLRLLAAPLVFVIIYAGIYERQSFEDEYERKNFLSQWKLHALRFLSANLVSIVLYYLGWLAARLLAGPAAMELGGGNLVPSILSVASSTLMLLWYSALVIEPKLFRSFLHVLKTLLFNPITLAIALIWFAADLADSLLFDFSGKPLPLAIALARSGVFALLKMYAVMYFLVIYKNLWGALVQRQRADEILTAATHPSTGEGLAKASLGVSFFSFVPFVHLVALILGIVSLKRSQRFILKAAVACCAGGFFTILYALVGVGYLTVQKTTLPMPDYSFLSAGSEEAQPYVDLLEQAAYADVQAELEDTASASASRSWNLDAALAVSEYRQHALDNALKDFYAALQKKPERSEFYFYYGLALVEKDNPDMALEQFQLALKHEPQLEIAKQYVSLVQNRFQPTQIISALMYLVILFFLFTVHEYGHAFAAWKLGDDTAKNLGRLTLNPIVHLDLFGSILLPAILLLQQSGVFFGWARPVPVDPRNFKHPKRDHMLVSFAGPAVNLLVAMVCMLVLVSIALLIRLLWPATISLNLVNPFLSASMIGPPFASGLLVIIVFIKQLFYTSLILGFFNLLPIPPLDGSWILAGILPESLQGIFDFVRRFGFMLFILLTLTPVFDAYLGIPIGLAWLGLRSIVSALGFA
jgi:Zn-dependent protease